MKIKLVIEVDGGIHDNEFNKEYDIERTNALNKLDIRVIRFKNEEVVNDIEKVVREIRKIPPPPEDLTPNPSRNDPTPDPFPLGEGNWGDRSPIGEGSSDLSFDSSFTSPLTPPQLEREIPGG